MSPPCGGCSFPGGPPRSRRPEGRRALKCFRSPIADRFVHRPGHPRLLPWRSRRDRSPSPSIRPGTLSTPASNPRCVSRARFGSPEGNPTRNPTRPVSSRSIDITANSTPHRSDWTRTSHPAEADCPSLFARWCLRTRNSTEVKSDSRPCILSAFGRLPGGTAGLFPKQSGSTSRPLHRRDRNNASRFRVVTVPVLPWASGPL